MYSPELQAQIAEWRRKSLDGTITLEETREAIAALRQGRFAAQTSSESAAKRSRAKAAIPDAQALLDELGGM